MLHRAPSTDRARTRLAVSTVLLLSCSKPAARLVPEVACTTSGTLADYCRAISDTLLNPPVPPTNLM